MNALLKKLQVKDGSLQIISKPKDIKLSPVKGNGDRKVVLVFITHKIELTRVPKKILDNQLLWVAYPKGGSKVETDLNRDILRVLMEKRKLTSVSIIALDGTWSAMRFRA